MFTLHPAVPVPILFSLLVRFKDLLGTGEENQSVSHYHTPSRIRVQPGAGSTDNLTERTETANT